MKLCRCLFILLPLLYAAQPALGDWEINAGESSVRFSSTKNGDIVEEHRFTRIRGVVTDAGYARVEIVPRFVDTGIEIRDQRMRRHLFRNVPDIVVEARLDAGAILEMAVRSEMALTIEGTLTLNDVETIIPLRVKVSRPDDSRIVVASTQPIAINVAAFGFEKGVDKLRELAALASIDTTVPVSFSLTYNSFRL